MKVLVTGGAGYVGSELTRMLLDWGHEVRVLDSLHRGVQGILPLFRDPHFGFVRSDIRDLRKVGAALRGVDLIVHLAAIVGMTECNADPIHTRSVNAEGTAALDGLRGECPVVYASTGSVYGVVKDQVCTEDSPTSPLSVYGRTKQEAEMRLMDSGNATSLRFATGFGISPNTRLDLLVNDFCARAVLEHHLAVFQPQAMRTLIHVHDMARALGTALGNFGSWNGKVYNVGDKSLNVTKGDLARKIADRTSCSLGDITGQTDQDRRDYEVCYDRLRETGYATTVTLDDGLDELVRMAGVIVSGTRFVPEQVIL